VNFTSVSHDLAEIILMCWFDAQHWKQFFCGNCTLHVFASAYIWI